MTHCCPSEIAWNAVYLEKPEKNLLAKISTYDPETRAYFLNDEPYADDLNEKNEDYLYDPFFKNILTK
jgi:hypothetical protein